MCVSVNRLTKITHFIPIAKSISAEKLANVDISEVVRHEVPVLVVSGQDVHFNSRFLRKFHEEFGTQMHFCTKYHPRPMGRVSGRFRHSKICSGRVCLILAEVGILVFH